jgi:integrase
MLKNAHREIKTLAHGVAIYWRHGRGSGSIPLATFRGATLEEALKLEGEGAAELAEAWIAAYKPRPATGNIMGMVHAYLASTAFARLSPSTAKQWSRTCDTIRRDLGHLTRRQLESDSATGILIDWRDRYEDTPRKADYLMTVLRAIFKHARIRGWLSGDPTKDISCLYHTNRSEIIWHDHEIDLVCATLGPDMARAVRFVYLTGFRRGDAVTVRWDAVQDGAIKIRTAKSKGRTAQEVRITPALQALLDETPRRAITILSAGSGKPYTPNAITHALSDRLKTLRKKHPDFAQGKRLHDMRGSRASQEVAALLNDPAIRRRMGWSEGKTDAPASYVNTVTTLEIARKARK